MVIDILIEITRAFGRFFMNPLLYVALLVAIWLGYRRVKRERKYFHIRILGGWSEFASTCIISLGSIIVSLIIVAIGLTVPVQFLYFVMGFTFVAMVVYYFYLLSPIVIFTLAFMSLVAMQYFDVSWTFFNHVYKGVPYDNGFALSVTAIASLLLILEGLLIARDGERFASPIIEKTTRGLASAAFFSKKLWLVPMFFIVPGNVMDTFTPWWPQITLGSSQYSLVLFPIVIGFQQKVRKTLPVYIYPEFGQSIVKLGVVLLIVAVASYFEGLIAVIGLPVAMVIRFVLSYELARKEKALLYAISPTEIGVKIIAVLPDSPAQKMGLVAGETIKRVNGKDISNERELYEALQINAAHCRLEVLDHQNELRLTQHVVHNNDNHTIGVITFH